MNNLMQIATKSYIKDKTYDLRPGDTVQVFHKIVEGENERVQIYEGLVIAIKGSGTSKHVTVRKYSYGIGVEKTFPLNSPRIEDIKIIKRGKVRRAKLYYIRDKVGKETRVEEIKYNAATPEQEENKQVEEQKDLNINK